MFNAPQLDSITEVPMLSDALHQAYTRARWSLLLRGLLSLAVGILIFFKPMDSAAALALIIAIWALFSGISQIVDGVELRAVMPHWWVLLLGGLVSVGFGFAALYYYPTLSLVFAVVWTAYWLLLSGFFGIYASIVERRVGAPWGWTLAFGILGVLAGLYAVLNPSMTLGAIIGLIAGFAIVSGIVLLIAFFRLAALQNQVAGMAQPARV